MQGFPSAAHRLAQLPNSPQHLADGGPVGFGARGLAGLRDLVPKMAAMGYPQAAAPAPAPAADPRGAAGLRAMIPQVEAMGYKQASAPAPQYFARGGVVRGPGTGTSDSIETEAEPGTFIMPADSTEAIGPSALEQMGTMPVRLSDGEYQMPPEQVMAIGEAVLKLMKDATHAPVNGMDGGQSDAELAEPAGFAPSAQEQLAAPPEQRFADGGLVDPTRRPNSFGDAAAVARDPGVMQVNTGRADPYGRPAPAPAPRPAPYQPSAMGRMTAATDPRSTTYSANPYAAGNSALQAGFAGQQGSRGIVEMGQPPAPAPLTARNSFGDATAATVDPNTTQVATRPGLAATALASAPPPAAAPMGWQARNDQRNLEVTASSIMASPERAAAQQRLGQMPAPAGLPVRSYADGGSVEDERRRLAQIPTGGQMAPAADGSQSNPLNTDLGRNVTNTLSALPGVGAPARAGATAARAGGAVANTERAIPATWEVVQEGGALASRAAAPAAQQLGQLPGAAGGPLARAATMAPQQAAPALAAPGGQVATLGAQPVGLASRGAAQMAEVAPAAAGAGQAASAGGSNLGRYAAGAAGLGATAMLAGATGETGAMPTQPAGFAPNALAAPAQGPAPAAAAMSQMPAPTGMVTRDGNSYSGPANIAGDVSINGAAPRNGGQISAQNMAAADSLAGRQAQESAARVLGQMPAAPAGFQAPTVRNSTNDWALRKELENARTSASSITNTRRWGGRGAENNPDQAELNVLLRADAAARGAQTGADLAAMQETGASRRAAAADAGATQRALIGERGQNQRAAITAARGQQPPAGYQWAPGGGLTHIPGGPADPSVRGNKAPLNDVQSKALQFGTRMQEAGSIIDKLATAGVTQSGLIKRGADAIGLGGVANFTQSPEQQQVEQAQRDFINAVLRRESGAAIADSEFSNANKQYFIQPGDSPEVQAQKRRNREIATAGILAEVPDSEKRVGQVLTAANANSAPGATTAAAPAAPPQIAELQRRAANNPALAARLKEMGY
ncbi:hypothetical protein LJR066_002849 [Acidovorax sp. LjRoot66]|uniref:hypothetical protein n=1 Tax=Acidovorax sp. LjRoot66 TaxID=3342334 RepID=UPI003ECF209F